MIDWLVFNYVLELVGPGARLLYVGKTAGYHSRTQEEIHYLLLSFAEAGATVVRLKGGGPLEFGTGGEEMDFLQQQGIQVEVIPSLGIPLTHRGVANSAADPDSSLVFYMSLSTLPSLALKLMQHGLPANAPTAAIELGTTPQQCTVFAELRMLLIKLRRKS